MIAVRKAVSAFGRGSLEFLRPDNRKILAYLRAYDDEIVLCVANLARNAQPVELDLARFKGRVPVELMGRTPFPPVGDLPYLLTLSGHGFLWFRLAAGREVPEWHEERIAPLELPFLVLFDGWASLFRDRVVPWRIAISERVRTQLEVEVLPAYVATRRWYATKGDAVRRVSLADHVEWRRGAQSWLLALAHVERDKAPEPHTYFLPLSLAWEDREEERVRALAPFTIARVRQQAEVGVLADALGDEAFCRELVVAMGAGEEIAMARGRVKFQPSSAFASLAGPAPGELKPSFASAQGTNTGVVLGERLFLKAYRRVQAGVNPEAEIGRFLTEVAQFRHAVPVAGSIGYVAEDGREATLALLQGYVDNQGDGWRYTLEHLDRYFERSRAVTDAPSAAEEAHAGYLSLTGTLGRRTAELHAAFARATGDPAFDPEPFPPAEVARLVQRVRAQANVALDRLEQRQAALPEAARADAARIIGRRAEILARLDAHAGDRPAGPLTRVHGDYHLGQVLLVENDFVIADFEGEPSRSLAERREKISPLKDVAGMLRSFDYALHAALLQADAEWPEAHAGLERLGLAWRDAAWSAFLEGYDAAARAAGLASPKDEARGLLELFLIEKALYELAYEVDNRPDWARIPLRGLARILDPGL